MEEGVEIDGETFFEAEEFERERKEAGEVGEGDDKEESKKR